MEQGLSSEADSLLDSQEYSWLLWNWKLHYHVHMTGPSYKPVESVHTSPYFFKIHFDVVPLFKN